MADPTQNSRGAATVCASPGGSSSPARAGATTDSGGQLTPAVQGAASSGNQEPSRPAYLPQFSAATQMLLKRIENRSLSSGLSVIESSQPKIKVEFDQSAYEDARRQVIMGMKTSSSMTLEMPAPAPPSQLAPRPIAPRPTAAVASASTPATSSRPRIASGAAGLSAIRRVTMGLTASGRPIVPKSTQPKTPTTAEPKKPKANSLAKAGTKRKRSQPRGQDDDTSSLPTLSDLSEHEDGTGGKEATPSAPLTTTKSGRHVQKPATYNPAAMESSGGRKRVHHSKVRTAEQALCKRCTRMHSPASNQMVFCDGCNEGWHQTCHQPWIVDEVVRDTARAWFCSACHAKRARHNGTPIVTTPNPNKKQRVAVPVKESWAAHTPQQKRAYLSTLPQQELVGLLMYSLELHPDLPIFPGASDINTSTPGTPETPLSGKKNAKAGAAQKGGKARPASLSKESSQEQQPQQQENEVPVDPLEEAWPKGGFGLYSLLPPEKDDDFMGDDNDFESFSVIIYDEKGRKIEENGIKIAV